MPRRCGSWRWTLWRKPPNWTTLLSGSWRESDPPRVPQQELKFNQRRWRLLLAMARRIQQYETHYINPDRSSDSIGDGGLVRARPGRNPRSATLGRLCPYAAQGQETGSGKAI